MEINDWTKPDSKGNIHVPEELDELVNAIGMQIKFLQYSGKNEGQTVCDIAFIAQKFFHELHNKKKYEK